MFYLICFENSGEKTLLSDFILLHCQEITVNILVTVLVRQTNSQHGGPANPNLHLFYTHTHTHTHTHTLGSLEHLVPMLRTSPLAALLPPSSFPWGPLDSEWFTANEKAKSTCDLGTVGLPQYRWACLGVSEIHKVDDWCPRDGWSWL